MAPLPDDWAKQRWRGQAMTIARRRLGLTQQQVADRIGVTPQTIARWEKGENITPGNYLPRLAELLRLDDDLMYDPVDLWGEMGVDEPTTLSEADRRDVLDRLALDALLREISEASRRHHPQSGQSPAARKERRRKPPEP